MEGNGLVGHRRSRQATAIEDLSTATATATTSNNGGDRSFRRFKNPNKKEDDQDGGEVWGVFSENFQQVQSHLDRNRVLIQQVNENHQSKIQANLVKNVALIQEINSNISKVVSLYSDMSANVSSKFHQRSHENRDGSKE